MTHPLVGNLSSLSINELDDKISDLQRKYFISRNPEVQHQISLLLDTYKEEVQVRKAIDAQRQKEQQDGENGLDNLINVS